MTSEREQDGALPPQAMLTVAAVARRLGVAPSTLRTWDRRYGLGPSTHTAGSHRRYSPSDVSRLVVMRGLVMEGVPPAEAAQIALGTPVGDERAATPAGPRPPAQAPGAPPSAEESPAGVPAPDVPLPHMPVSWPAPRSGPPWPVKPSVSQGRAAWSPASASGVPGVPASRGAPLPEGGSQATSGRALWPATRLAARHLLQAPGAGTGPVRTGTGGPAQPVDAPSGAGPDLDVARPGAADAGFDAALAQVIDEAMGRPHGHAARSASATRPGGGRVISLPDASPRARGLARAAMSLDTHELGRLLRDAIGAYGVVSTWDTMVMPVLRGLGERWQATADGIDVEHAFAEAAMAAFRGVTAMLYRPRNVRPVLLACAEGDQHSLPLHVLSAALAEVEVGCRMLGVGMPAPSLVAATRRTGPAVVFMYACMPVPDASALREFPRQRPAPRVLVGGPGWERSDLPAGVGRVDSLPRAVADVRSSLQL